MGRIFKRGSQRRQKREARRRAHIAEQNRLARERERAKAEEEAKAKEAEAESLEKKRRTARGIGAGIGNTSGVPGRLSETEKGRGRFLV